MFGFGSSKLPGEWRTITSIADLNTAIEVSHHEPVVLFKHSTRCSISSMALNRLSSETNSETPLIYYLDLIAHRDVSNTIAEQLHVYHESPQVIVVKNGEAVYDESHGGIRMSEIQSVINS
jgi:bacillithiol system protein YtxJ